MDGKVTQSKRIAWSLAEIANQTGLSLGFLRNEVRAARLPIRKFGRRVLVRDEDLQIYLNRGSTRSDNYDRRAALGRP